MSSFWFTADTHFSQGRTLKLSQRPFSSAYQMDLAIIGEWNRRVGDDDIVYHLGDWGNPDVVGQLRGKEIRLIRGNHDTREIVEALRRDKRITSGKMNDLYCNGQELFKLVHKPSMAKQKGAFYLFAHIHDKIRKVNGLNVGVDCHDFAPVSLNEALWWKEMIVSKGRAWNLEVNYLSNL